MVEKISRVKDTNYSYYYQMKQKADIGSMVANITAAIAVGAVTGGAGAAAMAGITAGAGATQMKKGSITINEDYDETIVSSILNAKNIKIKSKKDTNIQSSELNATDNKILDIKGILNITQDTEEHKHEHTEEKFGGDIINAAIAGAITGLTSAAGTGNPILTSYTTSVGNSMSNALLSGGSLKDAFKTGLKSLTDKDIIKNSITSGIVSSITVGLTDKLNNSIITNNTFTTALKEATASSLVNTTVQNTISGGSFKDMLKDQFVTSIVMAGANMATKSIGSNYHEGNINKGTQLFLHGVTGAAASGLLGKDMLSGAVSSIVGEVTGDILRNNGVSKEAGSEIAGLVGGLSALATGILRGLDESEISSSVFNGQRLGKNAAENNAFGVLGEIADTLREYRDTKSSFDGNSDYYNDNSNDKIDLPKEVDNVFVLDEASQKVLDSLPELPDNIQFMNGGTEFKFSFKEGITASLGFSLIKYDGGNKGSVGVGNFDASLVMKPKEGEISFGGGVSVIKYENDVTFDNGISTSVEVNAVGASGSVSTKNKPSFSTGFDYDIGIKRNN